MSILRLKSKKFETQSELEDFANKYGPRYVQTITAEKQSYFCDDLRKWYEKHTYVLWYWNEEPI